MAIDGQHVRVHGAAVENRRACAFVDVVEHALASGLGGVQESGVARMRRVADIEELHAGIEVRIGGEVRMRLARRFREELALLIIGKIGPLYLALREGKVLRARLIGGDVETNGPAGTEREIDRAARPYDDFQKWCREIVWWGNKKGAYLYSPNATEITPELAGHY